MSRVDQIRKFEKKRVLLFRQLLETRSMIRGSFSRVFRRCGSSRCWCAQGEGHPYQRITWTEGGVSKTKAIADEDIDWVKEVTRNYRLFRKLRSRLRKLEAKQKDLLDQREEQVIKQTKKNRPY